MSAWPAGASRTVWSLGSSRQAFQMSKPHRWAGWGARVLFPARQGRGPREVRLGLQVTFFPVPATLRSQATASLPGEAGVRGASWQDERAGGLYTRATAHAGEPPAPWPRTAASSCLRPVLAPRGWDLHQGLPRTYPGRVTLGQSAPLVCPPTRPLAPSARATLSLPLYR